MKIIVIPSWHPTPVKPLWCTWVLPHINALKEAGHDVFVLQVDMETPFESMDEFIFLNKQHIYGSFALNKHKFFRTRFFYGRVLKKYSQKLQELYKVVEKEWGKPDVIHAHVSLPAGYGAAELGKKENIPVIVTEHYSGFESDARFWWRVGSYVKEMGKKIQGFYTVSPGNAERIERTGLLKVTGVLPNPIDTKVFSPKDIKRTSKKFEMATAGGLSHRKGVDVLFDGLRLVGDKIDWHLTLFGNIDAYDIYSEWLNDPILSDRITLKGKVSQAELVAQYSISDLYIVSSRVETANVSMLEAMACGCAVLTTEIGAPETLIDDTVVISVPTEDPRAMAEAILRMSKSVENYKKEDLREFVVCNYGKKAVLDKMIEAYNKVIQLFKSRDNEN